MESKEKMLQIEKLSKELIEELGWSLTYKFLLKLPAIARTSFLIPYFRKGITDKEIHKETGIGLNTVSLTGRKYWSGVMKKKLKTKKNEI